MGLLEDSTLYGCFVGNPIIFEYRGCIISGVTMPNKTNNLMDAYFGKVAEEIPSKKGIHELVGEITKICNTRDLVENKDQVLKDIHNLKISLNHSKVDFDSPKPSKNICNNLHTIVNGLKQILPVLTDDAEDTRQRSIQFTTAVGLINQLKNCLEEA